MTNENSPKNSFLDSNSSSLFPKAYLSVSREEFYGQDDNHQPLDLVIKSVKKELVTQNKISTSSKNFLNPKYWNLCTPNQDHGPLPDDLKGHVFVIGTAGSFDSKQIENTNVCLPTHNGFQSAFSGDGMIYRLDFHATTFQTQYTGSNSKEESKLENIQSPGWAKLATRLIKTPDYYVDCALKNKKRYQEWNKREYKESIFRDTALNRMSNKLGGRNFLNTAWLPMKSKKEGSERLLVTWDAGRPYEVNPCTLSLLGPVGWNKDWQPMCDTRMLSKFLRKIPRLSKHIHILNQLFPLIVATAHPVYDSNDDFIYGVNVTRSLSTIFQIPRSAAQFNRGFSKLFIQLESGKNILVKFFVQILKSISIIVINLVLFIFHLFLKILDVFSLGGENCLFLYRWNSQKTSIDKVDKWKIIDSDKRPIKIYQTTHQMALTKDYVIISDSSFKIALGDLISSVYNPKDFANGLITVSNSIPRFANWIKTNALKQDTNLWEEKKLIGNDPQVWLDFVSSYLNYTQFPYTDIYVVPRPDRFDVTNPGTIVAKHFRISPETAHFLTNYDNSENKIVLHAGHIVCSDPAEFVHNNDKVVSIDELDLSQKQIQSTEIDDELRSRSGILVNSIASSNIGAWILDLNDNQAKQKILQNKDDLALQYLPFLGFFTTNENFTEKVTNVYWSCGGDWAHNLTEYYYELYKDRLERENPNDPHNRLIDNLKLGKNSNLLHISQSVDSERINLEIEDYYDFPDGYFGTSPQFVPRQNSTNKTTEGYIISLVFATDNYETDTDQEQNRKLCEFWIFDASHLSQGPIFRLSHPKMNIGPTLHTTWLSKLESFSPRADYNVKNDYQVIIDQLEPEEYREKIIDLFEQDVYPCLSNPQNCQCEKKG